MAKKEAWLIVSSKKTQIKTLNQHVPILILYPGALETQELRWPRDRYELRCKPHCNL